MSLETPAAPSGNTPKPSRAPMQLVGERSLPDQPSLSTLIAGAAASQTTPKTMASIAASIPSREGEFQHRAAWKAGVLASINVLAIVLAVRFSLLVAIVGAIVLTFITIEAPDPWRLGALGVYTALVVLPATWLASRR